MPPSAPSIRSTVERPDAPASPVSVKQVTEVMEGVRSWINPLNGFKVIDLEFKANPRKRSTEWIAQSKQGVPTAEWNREFGSQWIVYDGKTVYGDFDANAHVVRGPIIAPRRTRLISGWDAGPNDVNLAWALGITAPGERRVQFIDYYFADDGDTEDFVQVVGGRLRLEWMKLGGFSIHVADQSVFTKSGVAAGRTVADIMRQHGMAPVPGEISFSGRRVSVEHLLSHHSKAVDGRLIPSLQVHERCDMIVEGFQGGYSYGRSTVIGGSTWKETPLKNKFSHVMNAVEYVCSRLDLVNYEVPYEGRRLPKVQLV